jgi:DNA-binding response OmpR family regulator
MIAPQDTDSARHGVDAHGEETLHMLIVDDNEMVRTSLQEFFEAEGYEVAVAEDGEEGLRMMQQRPSYDVVLLDITLPKKNGFDVLRESQEMGLLSPVLMITGRGEQENILKGFGLGAADYVVKPFSPEDLAARVKTIVGRGLSGKSVQTYRFGSIKLDFRSHQAWRGEKSLALSEVEFDLLRYLIQHRGQVITMKRLIREALTIDPDTMMFSIDHDTMSRTIEQHMAALRDKIETNPASPTHLETVFGLGYRFND